MTDAATPHYRLRWPTTAEECARLKSFQETNRQAAERNPNDRWMAEVLRATPYRWTPQARWGYRIFDFWCHQIGVAIEVDGPDHNRSWDAFRDQENYRVSGILVLRVRNRNEDDARLALARIAKAESWNERRASLGLKPILGGTPHTRKTEGI